MRIVFERLTAGTGLLVALLALSTGCGGGGATNGGASAGSNGTGASSGATTSASTWSYPLSGTPTPAGSGSSGSSSGSGASTTTGTASGAGAGTSTSGSGSSGAGTTPPATSAGATLKGTIPPDPATGFGGSLFLVGTQLQPGSIILVSYQGALIKGLPTQFYSSQLLGMQVFLQIPGDYSFTALAPDGSTSTAIPLNVPSGGPLGAYTYQTPAIQMAYPTAPDTSFAGTMWILGEHFMPGSTLLVSFAGGPEVAMPLVFTNERSVGWVTGSLPAGNMTMRVMNPTFLTSAPVTVLVKGAATSTTSASGKPAPTLLAPPHSVTTPFLGVLEVYGSGFQVGATLELTDAAGATTTSDLLFISSGEVFWELAYPTSGSYTALVRNPDGQASPSFQFHVQ